VDGARGVFGGTRGENGRVGAGWYDNSGEKGVDRWFPGVTGVDAFSMLEILNLPCIAARPQSMMSWLTNNLLVRKFFIFSQLKS
jgi:hypothetical protein